MRNAKCALNANNLFPTNFSTAMSIGGNVMAASEVHKTAEDAAFTSVHYIMRLYACKYVFKFTAMNFCVCVCV